MFTRRAVCLAIAGAGVLIAMPVSAQGWRTYSNPRFGTTIEYPERFRPGRPPDNGGGLRFASADGGSFSVWGSHNSLEHNLAGLEAFTRENRNAGERITYDARGANWFVIAGTEDDAIFYERYLLSHRGTIVNGLAIRYPERLRKEYDAVVTRMSGSLRAGRSADTEGNP
jgi:serine/threonine-protein kinase